MYGDRMSAIIDATTVHPADPRYFELGLNLFHASALASLQFDDGRGHALALGSPRSNVGDLAYLSENDFGEPQYSDGFARVDYSFSRNAGSARNADIQRLDRCAAIKGEQRARAQYRNIYAWATLDHDWNNGATTRVIASFTDLDNRRQGESTSRGCARLTCSTSGCSTSSACASRTVSTRASSSTASAPK